MTLDNIAALFIQPPVGAWSDRLRTKIGRRMPFILIGAPIGAVAFGIIPLAGILPLFVACTSTLILSMAIWRTPVVALMPDITPSGKTIPGKWNYQFHGRYRDDHSLADGRHALQTQPKFSLLDGFRPGHPGCVDGISYSSRNQKIMKQLKKNPICSPACVKS